jgi:toxin ParE1/3/4
MIELSAAAAKDIEAILGQSLVDLGWLQTEAYYESLKRCLELLSEHPAMGSAAEHIRAGYRRFTHESLVVFYRVIQDGILMICVLHRRMDVGRHF